MDDVVKEEAIEFSTKFNQALSSMEDAVHEGVIHELSGDNPPSCYLGPHFPRGMPQVISQVLDEYQIDTSWHFSERDWSSWRAGKPQGWPTLTDEWKAWVPRMEHYFGNLWKEIGIFHAIKLTEQEIVAEKPMLAAALCFWASATNTMNLPLGYMSPTILDICTITGLSPIGIEINANHSLPTAFMDSFLPPKHDDKEEQMDATNESKRHRNYSTLYNTYGVVDSKESSERQPVKKYEHAAFLFYWLCKYVFCCKSGQCPRDYAAIAEALASGTKLALGPFVLAHLYRSLHRIVTDRMNPNVGGPLWMFQLWLRTYFPQLSVARPEYNHDVMYGQYLMATSSSHMSFADCFKMFYTLRSLESFSVCYSQWHPASTALGLNEPSEVLSEVQLRETWASFLISRDLHYGLATSSKYKPGVEIYLPNYFARQFGFMQSCPVPYQHSENLLSSWRRKFRSKSLCIPVSKRFRQHFNRFKMRIFQPSSRPTPPFSIWWSSYSSKFVNADLMDLFTTRILKGISNGPEYRRAQKRGRTDEDLASPNNRDGENQSASKKRNTIFITDITEISPSNSSDSNHTVELFLDDNEAANKTWVESKDTMSIEDSAQSVPKDDEEKSFEPNQTSYYHEPSPIEIVEETTSFQYQQTNQVIPPTHLLSADTLALLDKLTDQQTSHEQDMVNHDQIAVAAKFVEDLCHTELVGVVGDNLYSRFKEELNVLISAHHFSHEKTQKIEEHLEIMDASIPVYITALKKWDTGRRLERNYGDIVARQSSRAAQLIELRRSYDKDVQELAELEKHVIAVRDRMTQTTATIQQQSSEHHRELEIFSRHGKATQEFLAKKEEIDSVLTTTSIDWDAWRKILL
ncbi:uncharacterized protein LOC112178068 [Rosa chinensis]|uniref:uncharacterized protein LOC112178068 n=1 Tax=Rosa chinensis TaxID=74649 RepID=UPI001AD8FAA7|nr:uncharacterized protein LOC112178068 [Rosa chinensis]